MSLTKKALLTWAFPHPPNNATTHLGGQAGYKYVDLNPRQLVDLKVSIHQRLLAELDVRRLANFDGGDSELRSLLSRAIRVILTEASVEFDGAGKDEAFIQEVLDEILGLGHLEEFLRDPSITEIMVNGPHNVYIERKGQLEPTDKVFINEGQILRIIEKIVSSVGRRIDESSPMVDARLSDGSRVNAVIPPLSLIGPVLTIRKFPQTPMVGSDLVQQGSISPEALELLAWCVKQKYNILISGGTGTGKTTLLNILSSFIGQGERIITIEDAAELRLSQAHVISLEARPPNVEGRGAITIRDLVRNALRMRPDRIIVGEVRGAEALDMLQAMNTGHNGSLTTCHANSTFDALHRLEVMFMMAGMDMPLAAVRSQISSAIDIVVQQTRMPDGCRCITSIAQIQGVDNGDYAITDIFKATRSQSNSIGLIKTGNLSPRENTAIIGV